jgi:8-oxo-dGTP pyrophosphatase MutT (NUDIX family)
MLSMSVPDLAEEARLKCWRRQAGTSYPRGVADVYAAVGFLYHGATRKVLLHHRDAQAPHYADQWAGFGGISDPEDGGDPAVTWRREMLEELGVDLAPEQVRPLWEYVNPDYGHPRHIFYAEWPTLDDSFVLTEGDSYAWFPIDEAIVLPDLMELARADLIMLRYLTASSASTPSPASTPDPIVTLDARQNGHEAERPDTRQELYLIADELRGAATLWQRFAANVYEAERADTAMGLAARIAALANGAPLEEIAAIFNARDWRHVSPVIGVDAVVFNQQGEILLLRRRDNEHWCMPGGISEIGQTTAEAALRELWEEAGLRGEVVRLLGVFDGPHWGSSNTMHLIHLVYLVQCGDLNPVPGVEMLEARFFSPDALPSPLHSSHAQRVPFCIELARDGRTYADPASSYGIDLPMHQRPTH